MEGQTRLMNERLPIEEGAIAVLRRGQPLLGVVLPPVVVLNPPWLSQTPRGCPKPPVVVLNPPWLSYVKGAWEPDRHGGLSLRRVKPE